MPYIIFIYVFNAVTCYIRTISVSFLQTTSDPPFRLFIPLTVELVIKTHHITYLLTYLLTYKRK